ncbi:MAG: hypothetical protein JOY60_05870 [Burkholderiaceae bacterium]|nr:hypothetical protein [Burkholderiaceae bacterium]
MRRKFLMGAGLLLLAAVAAAVWVHNNLDERIKAAIEQYGSQAFGAPATLDLRTVASDAIVVRNIELEAPDVVDEKGGGGTNFDVIQAHVQQFAGSALKQLFK